MQKQCRIPLWNMSSSSLNSTQRLISQPFLPAQTFPAFPRPQHSCCKTFSTGVALHAEACRLLQAEHLKELVGWDGETDRLMRQNVQHNNKHSDQATGFSTSTGAVNDTTNGSANGIAASSKTALEKSLAALSEISRLDASETSTEAWRRAVKAGVIEVRPPPAVSVRAILPARKNNAQTATFAAASNDTGSSAIWGLAGQPATKALESRRRSGIYAKDTAGEAEPTGGSTSKAMATGGGSCSVVDALPERREATAKKKEPAVFNDGDDTEEGNENSEEDEENRNESPPRMVSHARCLGIGGGG